MELIKRIKEEEFKKCFGQNVFTFAGLDFYSFEKGSKVDLSWIEDSISTIKEDVLIMARKAQKIIHYRISTGDCILIFFAERDLKNRELYYTHFVIATSTGYVELNDDFTMYDYKNGKTYTFEPI